MINGAASEESSKGKRLRMNAYAVKHWKGGFAGRIVSIGPSTTQALKAAGAENITLSAAKIMSSEHVDLPEWAGYYEKIQVSVSESIRKKAYMATFSVI